MFGRRTFAGKKCEVEVEVEDEVEVEVARVIRAEELKFQQPKQPFMRTSTAEVYRGEYHGFQVAIKRYADQVHTSPR